MKLGYSLPSLLVVGCLFFSGNASAQSKPKPAPKVPAPATTAWKGRLVYGHAADINTFTFASKADQLFLQKAKQPYTTPEGEVYYVNDAFPKANVLIKKSNSTATQFRTVLDMSSDNPDYKQALEEYSVIRGTGISAVLSSLHDPRVSPDGRFLSVTVIGYPGQAFPNNCVAVFERATGKLVTRFEHRYYGTWLPDGRLLMCGAHKSGSTDTGFYPPKEPGIFLTDAALANSQRIDQGLDEPAPYHAMPSPDGKRVAFVLNNHVWVMNLDGSALKQLTAVANDNIETYPTWSPDGKYVACWAYKSFERSYYTAIAVVPAATPQPVSLTDAAPVWPRDTKNYRISGGGGQFSWR
ncbi:TolB family protein [Hymenobacter rigui]|uniref:Dipeptidylpeptidase IV N-terminal domain-containing protein n=1 Tax=Hymenobacter rigui TaxID=334424 RepID=A0A428KFP8_9BACT|nr:PD40 domain-containing protein [Hymenobacter rigui]RSK45317.1 hypothetical protein EI291_18325 [Hymenobacter rigui]